MKFLCEFYRKQTSLFWLALVTTLLITGSAILFRADGIRILPLYVSMVVMVLQANVNRYAFLLGGLNSLLYALVYALNSQYSSVIFAVLVSFPLQIVTFINWNKKTENNVTELRRLSPRQMLLTLGVAAVAWGAFYLAWDLVLGLIVNALGLKSTVGGAVGLIKLLDNSSTVVGILATVLTMLRFREYPLLQLVGTGFSLAIYTILAVQNPGQITYIIYTLYSSICVTRAYLGIRARERGV